MVGSFGAYLASFVLRVFGPRPIRPLAVLLSWLGYGVLTAGAYVGGDLVYRSGNQVDRHAWRAAGRKWKALDVGEVPEGTLVRAMMGTEPLVLFRDGDRIDALHATCAHAGGPLDKVTLVDGCVQCPWHGSRFRLADGHVMRGPAVYDQPRYDVRAAEAGGFEARRAAEGGGD
jgi:nitrite reductase/ring-hydroxylating ferredoxin subunit